ncbi:hypothetical protein NIES4074_26540 [Cylindrospermum sp. NIES-4074]|nr:hypothetical protein NIES4074_26540 [Cylindrospermum sp. NIES-4074]
MLCGDRAYAIAHLVTHYFLEVFICTPFPEMIKDSYIDFYDKKEYYILRILTEFDSIFCQVSRPD